MATLSDNKNDPLIIFTPSGKRGRFAKGTPILEAARALGVNIDSVCGGRGICGRCQIEPSFGEFAKHAITSTSENISPFGAKEERYKNKFGLADLRRLSCSAQIEGDIVIDVPPESEMHKQIVRKQADERDIILNPCIRLYYIEVEEPDMHNPKGDLERVYEAIAAQWNLDIADCDLHILPILQKALRKGQWKITVAIYNDKHIIAVWPELQDKLYGLAVDIGSTTIACHLTNMQTGDVVAASGIMNPQIRFGEDLMSRVSYVMMNPGGDQEMTKAVREAINTLIEQVCEEAEITKDVVLDAVFVGNPVMHHLFLGIDPTELGGAPFALAAGSAQSFKASDIDISIASGGRVYILPCIAGHVGADTAGVVLSEAPFNNEEITLLVDVGTNAEIVLGNKDKLVAASSPTGPAFEGAEISSGQRAAPGAIERVRIDKETLEPRFRIIGSETWSDEEGFAKEVENIGVTGICGSGIIEIIAQMYLAGIITQDGVIDGTLAQKSNRILQDGRTFSYLVHEGEVTVKVTQNDVRAIQLAKSALYAGCKLLMEKLGVNAVDKIKLAGAFGTHIDTKYALILGMIPDCQLENVIAAGNAAGTGARIALLNKDTRQEIEDVVEKIEKIETAVEPRFQEHFIAAMGIPNSADEFQILRNNVDMPKFVISSAQSGPKEAGSKRKRRANRRGSA